MATNYPTSLDSLTNPTSTDGLDSPDHAAQHANANDAIEAIQAYGGGWTPAGETWTYASSDDPTYTFTIASFDATSKYSAGMRVKLTDSGTQYFIITAVTFDDPGSTITVYGGTDYDLSTGAITNPYYSTQKAPLGFPLDPIKWSVEVFDTENRTQSSPTNAVWYNLGSVSIDIPVGVWELYYFIILNTEDDAQTGNLSLYSTLSTANNSESDSIWTCQSWVKDVGSTGEQELTVVFSRSYRKSLLTKDTFYLNAKTNTTGVTELSSRGSIGTTIIRAVSAYL